MASLTAGQLTNLRDNHPHVKKTYASPVQHSPILQARVNSPGIGLGAMSIPYNLGTGTAAQYALIEAEQVLFVGSTAGAYDLGVAYVKSITGSEVTGTITVAWNSDVDWADGAYLTIFHTYWIRPKFPRFTVSPEVHYKDYDEVYTDQNTNQPPVVVMGCGWAGFLSSGSVVIPFDGSNSYTVGPGATISSYLWSIATAVVGATPVISTPAASTTNITLDAPGLYWVKLTITDSAGKSQSSVRPVIAHDSTDLPYYIEGANRTEDGGQGGVVFSFQVRGLADENEIPNRTPIIIWSDNEYAGSDVDVSYLNANEYNGRTHIDFFGYVDSVSMDMSPDGTGLTSFTASTVDGRLKTKFEYSVPIVADPSATGGTIDEWWKYPADELTAARALHFLWKWHSNLLELTDVYLPMSDTRIRAGVEDFTIGSLWDKAVSFAREHSIFASPSVSIYGGVHIAIDLQMLDVADRAAATDTLTITGEDWQGSISILYRLDRDVAVADVSGGYWDGSTFTGLLSKYGDVATNDGSGSVVSRRLMVSSQANINMLCGRLVALANNKILEIRLTMAGNWSSAIGVAVEQWVRFSLSGSEAGNKRGTVLNNIRMSPIHIETSFNEEGGVSQTEIVFEPEAFGRDGVDGDYPTVPPTGGTTPSPGTPIPVGSGMAALLANSMYYLAQDVSTWVQRAATTVHWAQIDPWWTSRQSSTDPDDAICFRTEVGKIYRSTDSGATWSDVTPSYDPPNTYSDTPAPTVADLTFKFMNYDVTAIGSFYVAAEYQDGSGNWRQFLLKTTDDGDTWAWNDWLSLTNWWYPAGISTGCIGAYQAKGAANLAASQVNLANPGTYDLTLGGGGPTLSGNGWVFTGAEWLDTGISPDGDYSMFIVFDAPTVNDLGDRMALMGTTRLASGEYFNLYFISNGVVMTLNGTYRTSGLTYGVSTLVDAAAMVYLGATNDSYMNGDSQIDSETNNTITTAHTIEIGGYDGYGATIFDRFVGTIRAVAIYDRLFTNAEAEAILQTMKTLFGG